MHVTDVKTFLVHPGVGKDWLLVKVETDEGSYGCGDAHQQSTFRHTTAFYCPARRTEEARSPSTVS
ncbi:MAG: hypothetical protein LC748_08385, partial [Thermomicrobia bacterium]|nr:hypothetical protein [Thermomicrobia bacterium]